MVIFGGINYYKLRAINFKEMDFSGPALKTSIQNILSFETARVSEEQTYLIVFGRSESSSKSFTNVFDVSKVFTTFNGQNPTIKQNPREPQIKETPKPETTDTTTQKAHDYDPHLIKMVMSTVKSFLGTFLENFVQDIYTKIGHLQEDLKQPLSKKPKNSDLSKKIKKIFDDFKSKLEGKHIIT